MLTRRRTMATFISVCSILLVFGVVVFFDGNAEARRKPGTAPKSSGVEKAQDPEPAEATPDAETFLRKLHDTGVRVEGRSRAEILEDAAALLKQLKEAAPQAEGTAEAVSQDDGSQEPAGQDDGTSNTPENP